MPCTRKGTWRVAGIPNRQSRKAGSGGLAHQKANQGLRVSIIDTQGWGCAQRHTRDAKGHTKGSKMRTESPGTTKRHRGYPATVSHASREPHRSEPAVPSPSICPAGECCGACWESRGEEDSRSAERAGRGEPWRSGLGQPQPLNVLPQGLLPLATWTVCTQRGAEHKDPCAPPVLAPGH